MKAQGLLALWLFIWGSIAGAAIAEEGFSAEKPVTIVAFGDSLTEGYQLNKNQAYPYQLEQMLKEEGYNVRIINQGISGDTTAGGKSRLPLLKKAQPDIAIVALGANDFLRGIPPSNTQSNLKYIIRDLLEENIEVILVGIKPPPNIGPAYQLKFNKLYPKLQQTYPITLTYNFLEGVYGRPSLNLRDGIHPNPKGYKKVAENMLPVVIEVIEK